MRKSKSRKKAPRRFWRSRPRNVRTAVLNSLKSASGQRTYEHAIREFVAWYCSELRLAFNGLDVVLHGGRGVVTPREFF